MPAKPPVFAYYNVRKCRSPRVAAMRVLLKYLTNGISFGLPRSAFDVPRDCLESGRRCPARPGEYPPTAPRMAPECPSIADRRLSPFSSPFSSRFRAPASTRRSTSKLLSRWSNSLPALHADVAAPTDLSSPFILPVPRHVPPRFVRQPTSNGSDKGRKLRRTQTRKIFLSVCRFYRVATRSA